MQYHRAVNKAKRVREPDKTHGNKRQRRKAVLMTKKLTHRKSRRKLNDPNIFDIVSITCLNSRLWEDPEKQYTGWYDHYANGDYDKVKPRTRREFAKNMSSYK